MNRKSSQLKKPSSTLQPGSRLVILALIVVALEVLQFFEPSRRVRRLGWLEIGLSILAFGYFIEMLTGRNRTRGRAIFGTVGLLASTVAFLYFIFSPRW